MARNLFLPKQSLPDVRRLLELAPENVAKLGKLFGEADSISPRNPNFLEKVASDLSVNLDTASSAVLVTHFLLHSVEEGTPPAEILDDVKYFIEQHDDGDGSLRANIEANRDGFLALLTPAPKSARKRAMKVRYLQGVLPTVDSFRSVCELRPLFEPNGEVEEIAGLVPTILLEIRQTAESGEESQIILNLSPETLGDLAQVVKRTQTKLATIRQRFGTQILDPYSDAQEGDPSNGDQG